MKHPTQKIVSLALSLVLVLCLLPVTVFAAPVTYTVSTADEFAAALSNITSGGEFIISLTADITVTSATFNKSGSTVTIVGNGHTISLGFQKTINVSNGVTLNLGTDDSSNKLLITRVYSNDTPGAVYVQGGGTVNMYNGVTIKDCKGNNYFGGGVTVKGGTFNMKGGIIQNCGIQGGSVCFGGGVAVINGGKFTMDGGVIEGCYASTSLPEKNKGLIPWGAGGGVFVGGGSTFILNGGSITNCKASESGGGVFVVASKDSYFSHSSFGYLDSKFVMSNTSSITGCSAAYYGGGVCVDGYYVNAYGLAAPTPEAGAPASPGVNLNGGKISGNSASLGGGVMAIMLKAGHSMSFGSSMNISNNTATDEASDIFMQNVNGVTFGIDWASIGETYLGKPDGPEDIVGGKITDYFLDGDPRFTSVIPSERKIAKPENIVTDAGGSVSLIAALKERIPDPVLDTSPKTGDARQTMLWGSMLAVSCCTAAAAIQIGKKKYQS